MNPLSEKVYAEKLATSRNAHDMNRDVYDLHRKFGSEMAVESSRKMDGENLSLQRSRKSPATVMCPTHC